MLNPDCIGSQLQSGIKDKYTTSMVNNTSWAKIRIRRASSKSPHNKINRYSGK